MRQKQQWKQNWCWYNIGQFADDFEKLTLWAVLHVDNQRTPVLSYWYLTFFKSENIYSSTTYIIGGNETPGTPASYVLNMASDSLPRRVIYYR